MVDLVHRLNLFHTGKDDTERWKLTQFVDQIKWTVIYCIPVNIGQLKVLQGKLQIRKYFKK